MASSVRPLYRPIAREKWSVAVPPLGCSIESDMFYLEGKACKFRFETVTNNVGADQWSLSIMTRYSIVANEWFCLTAYVGKDNEDIYVLTHKEIYLNEGLIWTCSRDIFLESYPRIEVTGKIDFSFVFVDLRRVFQIFENEPKSIQTSSYMNDSLCRENLSLDLGKLMEDGSNPDVQLKCGDCVIPAHRLILGARSEVFRTMLQSDMLEGRQGSVEIVDMEPEIFQIFIRYLYTGNLPELAENIAAPLYEAADKYLLEALKIRCGEFLADNLTHENACGVLAIFDAHSDHSFRDRVVTYIINKKVPDNNEVWSKFCYDHPSLAIEVLNRAWQTKSYEEELYEVTRELQSCMRKRCSQ